jgi:N-acetylglutamate synthase-like GNAT family acetyltransferase
MTDLWLAKSTVFSNNPSAKVMKFIALGVDSGYEGKGLAKDLLKVSMDKAHEIGCDAVMVVASAFATQHLFNNRLGFELMGRVKYSEFSWVNEKTGKEERPFENLVEPEFLEIFEKKLV